MVRHLTGEPADLARRSTAFLQRVEQGEYSVCLTATVVFETVFTLQEFYGVPREVIRDSVRDIVDLPGVQLPGKQRIRDALSLYASVNISFADAYHAVTVLQRGLDGIVSFDRQLDRVTGLRRIEP